MPVARLRTAALALVLSAASTALHAQQPDRPEAPRRVRADRALLDRTEIEKAGGARSALDAIRLLRVWWLEPPVGRVVSAYREVASVPAMPVVAYIDGVRQPDIESSLVTVRASDVVEIRYLNQGRAVQAWGPGHESGVIEVTTVRGAKGTRR